MATGHDEAQHPRWVIPADHSSAAASSANSSERCSPSQTAKVKGRTTQPE